MELIEQFAKAIATEMDPIIRESVAEEVKKAMATPKKRYYSIREVCEKLHICEATFHNWARKGGIEKIYDNGEVKVDAKAIDEAVESGEIGRYKHRRS